jgi:hypothetical protein
MTTQVLCDGCGIKLGTDKTPNWWRSAFMGDTIRDMNGRVMESTGLIAPGNRQYIRNLDKVDLCIPCMAKTQEENTK